MKRDYTPTLIVPQRVLLDMLAEAAKNPDTETGAALVGIQGKDQIIVLDTILDLENAKRLPGQFSNGGSYQSDAFDWFHKNWELMRQRSRMKSEHEQVHWTTTTSIDPDYVPTAMDLPLSYLGDWHQQPRGMTRLSGGDLRQIKLLMNDPDFKGTQLLSPIVTHRGKRFQFEINGHEIDSTMAPQYRVSWYYTNKETLTPVDIKPFVVGDDKVPVLPRIPWYVNDPDRLNNEVLYLRILGHEVTWNEADIDKDGVLEGVFAIDNPLWKQRLIAVTELDYPRSHARFITVSKPESAISRPEPETEAQTDIDASPSHATIWTIMKAVLKFGSHHEENQQTPIEDPTVWDNQVYISDIVLRIEDERLMNVSTSTV